MTDHHTDDLIDYEEEEQLLHTEGASTHKQNNYNEATEEDKKDKKGSYVGVHATGFRDFLLKPELLRAIVDCGFEHPSEGKNLAVILWTIVYLHVVPSACLYIQIQTWRDNKYTMDATLP